MAGLAWLFRLESVGKANAAKTEELAKENKEQWRFITNIKDTVHNIDKNVSTIGAGITANQALVSNLTDSFAEHARVTRTSAERVGGRLEKVEGEVLILKHDSGK